MAVSRPLAVAIGAMVLLVGSVSFELFFQRSYALEVFHDGGWTTIGQTETPGDSSPRPMTPLAGAIIVNRSDDVQFRLRLDNGYPWSYAHHYDVEAYGLRVAEGDISAGGRDIGTSTFKVPASTLLGSFAGKVGPGANITQAYLNVQIGTTSVSGTLELQEAAS